jgi:hypothetical protein
LKGYLPPKEDNDDDSVDDCAAAGLMGGPDAILATLGHHQAPKADMAGIKDRHGMAAIRQQEAKADQSQRRSLPV